MYRPSAYAIDDVGVLQAAMRERGFATIAAVVQGRLQFAYAPVMIDSEPRPWGSCVFIWRAAIRWPDWTMNNFGCRFLVRMPMFRQIGT